MAPPSNLCSFPSPACLMISASGVFLLCLRHYRRTGLVEMCPLQWHKSSPPWDHPGLTSKPGKSIFILKHATEFLT